MHYEIKTEGKKFARIVRDGSGKFLAAINTGTGFDEVMISARWFKTEAGAKRWATANLA